MSDAPNTTTTQVIRRIEEILFEPDWWFDGVSAFRNGFDRSVPEHIPPGDATRLWLEGWDEAKEQEDA